MAYAAVVSLKHTLEQLMNSSSTQIIEFAYKEVNSLHKQLKMLDGKSRKSCVNALDEGLREELHRFEDVIESHVSQSPQGHPLDVQDLKPEIQSFTVALKKMKWAYLRESRNTPDDDDDDDVSSTLIDSGGSKPKIVGSYSVRIPSLKLDIMFPKDIVWTKIFSLVGMAGIGKTALAMEIYEDPDIVEHFEYRAWVRFGRKKYTNIEMARRILAQLNPADSHKLIAQGDEDICLDLQNILKSKRCFIVLDDVWDNEILNVMDLHHEYCGSRVLLTTRLQKAAQNIYPYILKMQLLNKEESWLLFCGKVFAEALCPPELVEPGKKIVEKCEGLPLLIVTVASLLSKTDNNQLEYWNKAAEDKRNQLLKEACKEIEEVLFPSYHHLPQHLKTCFLYMGVFPQDYEIPKSIITNLWTADRFLELKEYDTSESWAEIYLNDLVSNNVVLVYQRPSNYWARLRDLVKTCGLHSSFWHLCNREAEKNKFLHVFNNVEDGLEESIKGHRRLCIHNNVLFGIKHVYNSIQRVCAPTARSLLCYGSYHQYTVPMCFGLRLLKILDALAIRFYDFPLGVLKLVLLRYLALTCNGELPPSINELRRLEFLIVGRHLIIKSSGAPSYLPIEIWDMKELQHLQIMGSDLPDPCGNLLPKLLKLIGVSSHSCTKEVLKGIPRLKKLGIQIELEPDATHEPLRCFDHISNLNELESLNCVIVNPIPMFVSPPAPYFMLPSSLKKLHLSGLGYPWEYMTIIALLRNLRQLKLRCYAFQGPKWEIQENHFPGLMSLLIEDTDLVQLEARSGSFPYLSSISMKHCYRLQELHLEYIASLQQIELIDCNPLAVNYVQQTKIPEVGLVVHSSWNDGNLKSSQPTWLKRKFLKAR